ncbi:MAG: hypothetical protein ACO1QB_12095 [Verrucomicrobiales bacterium]
MTDTFMTTPFGISEEMTVVTSIYVTQDAMPILEVSHQDDEEGGHLWQFHAGNGDYSPEKLQLVRLSTILKIDPSVTDISNLKKGMTARRKTLSDEWRRS